MPEISYRWQCLACETGNEPSADFCQSCGCPVDADSGIVDGWSQSLSGPPRKPSNIGYAARWGAMHYKFTRTAPCPWCNLHMYITDAQCPHCDYTLTLVQRHDLIRWQDEEHHSGRRLALRFMPAFIVIMTIVLYLLTLLRGA